MGGGAAAVIILRERQVVEAFAQAGATSPDRATTPADLGVEGDRFARRLMSKGVLREAVPGSRRYYLDVERWAQEQRMRRWLGITILVVVLLAALFFFLRQSSGLQ